MGIRRPLFILLGLEVLAAATFVWHKTVSVFIGWDKSYLYLHILLFLALAVLLGSGLFKLLSVMAAKMALRFRVSASAILRSLVISLLPLLLLFLVFLPHIVFLKDIRPYLFPLSLFGSSYLVFIFCVRLNRECSADNTTLDFPGSLDASISSSGLAWKLFVVALLVYVFLISGIIFPAQPFTGDEPHYLMVTQSILKDGDINLYNNYRDKDYLAFYAGELEPHAYAGKKGAQFLYSKHFPALPVLLVPAYLLGEAVSRSIDESPNQIDLKRRTLIFFVRLPLCFLTALLGAAFFLMTFAVTRKKSISVLSWAFFSFTIPVMFYSPLIYSEIPAALLTVFVIRNLVINKAEKIWSLALSGVSIGLLPWFGAKYLVLAAVLFVVSMTAVAYKRKIIQMGKEIVCFLSPILVSAVFYLLYFGSLYGNFSVSSAYKGVSTAPSGSTYSPEPPAQFISDMLRRFLGYFIDQKYGLFVYSPIFLLGAAGIFFLLKRKKRETLLLLTVVLVYTLFSSAFYWGGFCPPARPLLPLLSIWGLFMAVALSEKVGRSRLFLSILWASLSFGLAWIALWKPWILYTDRHAQLLGGEFLYAQLWKNLSNAFFPVHTWLPSLSWDGPLRWIPIVFWVIILSLAVWAFVRKSHTHRASSGTPKMIGHLGLVYGISVLVLLYAFFDVHLDRKSIIEEENCEVYFQDDNQYGMETEGFWTKGSLPATILLKTKQPVSTIQLLLSSSVAGEATVQVGTVVKKVIRNEKAGFRRAVIFSSFKGFPMLDGFFYTVTIQDSTGFVPVRLDENIKDNRHLGVFVQISTRLRE